MAELPVASCQSPSCRFYVIQSEVVQTEPHKLLAIVSWVIAAGRWGCVCETGDAISHRKMIRKLNPLPPAPPRTHQHAVAIISMQNLCQLQRLHAHTHTQSHVAAEGHKLHKTGQQPHENGHSAQMVQLGLAGGPVRVVCVWEQKTQLVASRERGQLIICKICGQQQRGTIGARGTVIKRAWVQFKWIPP